jgi:hypothetical protein
MAKLSKVLQKPQIVEIIGSTIRIKHPDISGYTRTEVISPLTAAGTALSVADNNNFNDDDWFVLGESGDYKSEECDVNGAVTRGTSMTITNTTKFSHEIHTPITKIYERGIKIYGAATDGGAGTLITSVDAVTTPIADAVMIQWNQKYTEYTIQSTDTAYAYYFVKFTDGTTDSSASDYVLAAGLTYNTVESVVNGALMKVNAKIDPEADGLITREWLLQVANDFQDEVTTYEMTTPDGNKISKDWSFEVFEDETSLAITENENKYALSGLSETLKYDDSKEGILSVRIGTDVLDYIDINEYEAIMEGNIRTNVATATVAGDTSIVLDDTYELSESGTIYVGEDAVTYTTNTETTATLSGIPASGTGAITAVHAVGAAVWQNITSGTPSSFTIFNGNIMFPKPPDSDIAGYKIKVKGLKKLDRLTDFTDVFTIPFTFLAKIYIAAQIEYRKNNETNGDRLMQEFMQKLNNQALKDKSQNLQSMTYYNFGESDGDDFNYFNN